MTTQNTIDDLIYQIDPKNIVSRKKSPVISVLLILSGMTLILMKYAITSVSANPDMSSAFWFTGGLLLIVGVIKLLADIYGKGVPYYVPTGEKMHRHELKYDQPYKEKIKSLVTEGDFESLADIPEGESSAVLTVVYCTPGGEIILSQVLEYVPHQYRPVCEVITFKKGEYIRSARFV